MPRVFLTCHDPAFSQRLRMSFEVELGFEVCGDEKDEVEAIEKVTTVNPDLVVLEIDSSGENSILFAEAFKLTLPEVPLFLVTAQNTMQAEKDALTRGVDAVFEKEDYVSLLLNAQAAVVPE